MSSSIALHEQDILLHQLIANKVTRGYQLEFVTISGRSYFGFPAGIDGDLIQILVTPDFGQERGNHKHQVNTYDLNGTNYFEWIAIANIETVVENRLAIKHFNQKSQQEINRHQRSLRRRCEEWLDAQDLTTKIEGNNDF